MSDIHRDIAEPRSVRGGLSTLIAEAAEPLPDIDDPAFGALFDRFADARIVLLGEASHGTSEFYRARAAITRRLIEQHGFNIVAVEADWPDAASVDRYVRLAITEAYARCEEPVVAMLRQLHANRMEYAAQDGEEWLDAAANARLVKNAEEYYRLMYHGAAESW